MKRQSRPYGIIALTTCGIELIGIWGTVTIAVATRHYIWDWMMRPLAFLYVAGLAAIPLAVIGVVKDTRPALAYSALVLGFANIFLCSLPFWTY